MNTSAAPPRRCPSCGMPEHGSAGCGTGMEPVLVYNPTWFPTISATTELSPNPLQEAFDKVMRLREAVASAEDELARLRAEFNAEHEAPIRAKYDASTLLIEAETEARSLTIAAYEADPEMRKDVLPGCLGIREVKEVHPADNALEWALDHRIALKLDEGRYKHLVEEGIAPGTVSTKVTATIAQG